MSWKFPQIKLLVLLVKSIFGKQERLFKSK
jgi:hypothetical protein